MNILTVEINGNMDIVVLNLLMAKYMEVLSQIYLKAVRLITSLAVGQSVDPSSQMILLHILWISFSIGLSQSTIKLTINNSTYTLNPVEGNTYYYNELPTNDSSLILWMQSQVGKTIPVIIQ